MKSFFVLLVWWCFMARAGEFQTGSEGGNGGHGVLCQTPNGETLEVLDIFFMKRHGMEPDFGEPSLSMNGKILNVLGRLERLDKVASAHYLQESVHFQSDAVFQDTPLPLLNDVGESVPIPTNCKLVQIAIQKGPSPHLYYVDKNLWDKLDVNNQISLILHEAAYWDAIRIGHTSSMKTRRFIAALLDKTTLPDYTPTRFFQFIARLNFFYHLPSGEEVNLNIPGTWDLIGNGQVRGALLGAEPNIGKKVGINYGALKGDVDGWVQFDLYDGKPSSFYSVEGTVRVGSVKFNLLPHAMEQNSDPTVCLYRNGALHYLYESTSEPKRIPLQGKIVLVAAPKERNLIGFYRNGQIKIFCPAEDTSLETLTGTKLFHPTDAVIIDRAGLATIDGPCDWMVSNHWWKMSGKVCSNQEDFEF